MTDPISHVLVSKEDLSARIDAIAGQISEDYAGKELLLVGVLKGAVFFMADLARRLTVPCALDFMAVSSYGSSTDSSGVVRILKDLDSEIEGRDVLIVEDIIDSGLTLSYLPQEPALAQARLARDLRPAHQAVAAHGAHPLQVRRLRDPERVRRRLRPRLRGALPHPRLHRRAHAGGGGGRQRAGRRPALTAAPQARSFVHDTVRAGFFEATAGYATLRTGGRRVRLPCPCGPSPTQ